MCIAIVAHLLPCQLAFNNLGVERLSFLTIHQTYINVYEHKCHASRLSRTSCSVPSCCLLFTAFVLVACPFNIRLSLVIMHLQYIQGDQHSLLNILMHQSASVAVPGFTLGGQWGGHNNCSLGARTYIATVNHP